MADKTYQWHKVANTVEELSLGINNTATVTVAGKAVCLAIFQNTLYACAAKCPHAGGLMADGFVDAQGNIVCPLHRYRFGLQNGRNTSGEGYYLKTWPVAINEQGVFIGMEEKKGLFDW